jgi:hypothetical protein
MGAFGSRQSFIFRVGLTCLCLDLPIEGKIQIAVTAMAHETLFATATTGM